MKWGNFSFWLKEIIKQVDIIKQLLPSCEGNMTICSPSTGNITLGLRTRAILPASGEQTVMLPSHKDNNYIVTLREHVCFCRF